MRESNCKVIYIDERGKIIRISIAVYLHCTYGKGYTAWELCCATSRLATAHRSSCTNHLFMAQNRLPRDSNHAGLSLHRVPARSLTGRTIERRAIYSSLPDHPITEEYHKSWALPFRSPLHPMPAWRYPNNTSSRIMNHRKWNSLCGHGICSERPAVAQCRPQHPKW